MGGTLCDEAVRITTGRDSDGADVFGFLVKRAYRIDDNGFCVRDATPDFVAADEFWDDPETSGPRHEADIVAYKPATDVVVLGHVYAPGGAASQCTLGLQIGSTRRTIAVFGDRLAVPAGEDVTFLEPRSFQSLPIVFARAYGGPGYPRNPVGTGFVIGQLAAHGVELPNFEDPRDLLTPKGLVIPHPKMWNRQPLPVGTGWFGKSWYPRMSYVGVIPGNVDAGEVMREEALDRVPRDQVALGRQFRLPSWDARFANGAAPGLAMPYLQGDEAVLLVHFTPAGRLSFRLPGDRPRILADIGAGESEPTTRLYSVVIKPDAARLTLIWGACLRYPGAAWLPHMKRLAGRVA
jgi:hypothetical protein